MIHNYNIKTLLTHNFFSIPEEILKNHRLCLWKYEYSKKTTSKALKVPYGIDKNGYIKKNLKDKSLWFNSESIRYINQTDQNIFGLGIILNEGPYVCIDIDDCLTFKDGSYFTNDDVYEIIHNFSGTYCEISPSGKGLHIFFQGSWLLDQEKISTKTKHPLNLEIYSGNSCRFITLTGNRIISQNNRIFTTQEKTKVIKSYPLNSEAIQNMYQIFSTNIKKIHSSFSFKESINKSNYIQTIVNSIHSNKGTVNQYNILRKNRIAKSDSEDDYRFCLFILNHTPVEYTDSLITDLLIFFLQNERLHRTKIYRFDYVKRTAISAINYGRRNKTIGSLISRSQISKISISFCIKNLLKICNNMNIFSLNTIVRQQPRILKFNTNKNNSIEFYMPQALDSKDLDYFIEILYQYSQKNFSISNNEDNWESNRLNIQLNIPLIAKRLNKADCGSFRNSLIKSLKKLSLVKIFYNKQIVKNGKVHQGSTELLNYQHIISEQSISNNHKKSKIFLEVNFLTFSILKKGSYNYTLLNTQHRNILPNSQLRLLYNYICLKTIPGTKFKTEILLSEILNDLWLPTENQSTTRSRKKRLWNLLKELQQYSEYFSDFSIEYPILINPVYNSEKVAIRIQRYKAYTK